MLYAISVLLLFRLPVEVPVRVRESAAHAVAEGFRYVWRQRSVRTLMLIGFVPVLLGMPFQQFLPVFQEDVLHVSRGWLGLMFTMAGVGSLIGSLTVAYLAQSPRAFTLQLLAGLGFGLALATFALSTVFPVSLVFVGFASQGFFTMNNVLLMGHTEPQYYGRVMSIYMLTFALMPVAVLPMGIFIDLVGAPYTMSVAGGLLALFVGVFLLDGARRRGSAAEEPGTRSGVESAAVPSDTSLGQALPDVSGEPQRVSLTNGD